MELKWVESKVVTEPRSINIDPLNCFLKGKDLENRTVYLGQFKINETECITIKVYKHYFTSKIEFRIQDCKGLNNAELKAYIDYYKSIEKIERDEFMEIAKKRLKGLEALINI